MMPKMIEQIKIAFYDLLGVNCTVLVTLSNVIITNGNIS